MPAAVRGCVSHFVAVACLSDQHSDLLLRGFPLPHLLLLLLATLLAPGCSPAAEPPEEAPTLEAGEAIEALVALQVEHACREAWTCPARSYGDTPFLSRHDAEADCVEDNLLADFLRARYTRHRQAVAEGRMRYDGEAAARCVERSRAAFDETLCELPPLQDTSCGEIFIGLAGPEQPCVDDEECQGQMECVDASTGEPCTGRCRSCDGVACAEDEHCDRRGDTPRCVADLEVGDACVDDDQCGDSQRFACNLALGSEDQGECVEIGASGEGEACSEDEHCARGLACDGMTCVTARLAGEDDLCALTSPVVGICGPGAVCGPGEEDGTRCQAPLPEGAACTSLLQCEHGLQCEREDPRDPRTGTCRPLRPDGSPCSLPFECEGGQCVTLGPGQSVCLTGLACGF